MSLFFLQEIHKNNNIKKIVMCGAFFIKCRITGNGFAKAGILQPESPIKTRTEQKPFSFFQNYKKIKNEMVFCD